MLLCAVHMAQCGVELLFILFLQDFIAAQVPAVNVDNVELRRKFGAMVSSAILNDSSAAISGSSGIAALPSSKAVPVTKARADANVRRR